MGADDPQTRFRTILENVDAATDQVIEAAKTGDKSKVRGVMTYWFGVLYDAGLQRVRQVEQQALSLGQMVDRLRDMNEKLARNLTPVRGVPAPPAETEGRPTGVLRRPPADPEE